MSCRVWLLCKWRQIVYSLIIASALINVGLMVGWSVQISHIQNDTDLAFNATENEYEWLVSSSGIASIFFTLVSGYAVESVGPCRLIHLLLIPAAIGWLVMALSETYVSLLVGRIVTGGIGFSLLGIVQPLLAEICQADVRGMLSALPEFSVSLGMLLIYLFAKFFTWQTGTLISGLILIPIITIYFFVPESPYWLVRQGNLKAARNSLRKLRVAEHDVEGEVNAIKEAISETQRTQGSFRDQIVAMKEPANYRPTVLLLMLFIFRELGGAMVIFNYAAFFFLNANVPLEPFTAAVLVGVARLVFTLITAVLIDRVGRRPLFICSSMVCSLSMIACYISLHFPTPTTTWIPLLMVLIFVASFGMGSGVVPWVLLGELLPTPVRSLASSLCLCAFCTTLFFLVQFFPKVYGIYGLDDIVLGFGIFHLLAGLTAWLFLPETKNRTLEELQGIFAGAALTPFRKHREGYMPTYGSTLPKK